MMILTKRSIGRNKISMDLSQKRQEIIYAVIKILANKGFRSLSMKKIAKELGIHESTIYFHFKNKQDLLYGVFAEYKSLMVNFFKDINELDETYLGKLKAYFYRMCDKFHEDPDLMKLIMFEIGQFQDIPKKEFFSLFTYTQEQLCQIIRKAQENNEISKDLDPICIVSTIKGLLYVILKNRIYMDDYDVLKNCEKKWRFIESIILE